MSERLLIQLEGGAPVELPRSGVLSIGSATDADLVVEGPGVASAHCVIGKLKGGGWALKDLGSTAGTLVNGKPVQQARLQAGDEVVLGARRLAVFDPDVAGAPREPVAQREPEPQTFAVPEVRGYRIERRLGHGGMGSVFLAVQESLDRKVALKVLNPRLAADRDFVNRFQAEARAAAALSHPNVVTVHDVWEEGGHHLLAMEYMERGNLEDRVVRAGRIDADEVVAVLLEAAKGLEFAELRGIVHRDIKPANLMQDGLGMTKIADLGLATQLEAEATDSGGGRIFGTPHFISPEQARGETVDGRSDLYSLGATAYRLLSGRTPFEGQTTRDILRGHLTGTPRPLHEFAPSVGPELEALVGRLLEKDPADRYQTASELIAALQELGAGSTGGRGRAVLLGGLAALALAAGGAAFVLQDRGPGEHGAEDRGPGDGTPPAVSAADGSQLGASAPDAADRAESAPGGGSPIPAAEAVDDDSALKRLEAEALAAYRELPAGLAGAEREEALQELSARFQGTTAAGIWATELEQLREAANTRSSQRERVVEQSRGVLSLIEGALSRGDSIDLEGLAETLDAVSVPPVLATDPAFRAERNRVVREGLRTRLAEVRSEAEAHDALAAAGDFEQLRARLEAHVARLTVAPEHEPLEGHPLHGLPEWTALDESRVQAVARLGRLEHEAAVWSIEREHRAAARLAQALSPGATGAPGTAGSVRAPLEALDLAAARQALDATLAELGPEGIRGPTRTAEFAAALGAELEVAAGALGSLSKAFDDGRWRRKSILDPRGSGRQAATVVGAAPGGLLVEGDGGVETLSWSTFSGAPDALDQLFRQRLDRSYDARELAGIAALMRIAAVQLAVNEAAEMLDAEPALLTEGELESMLSGFELARPWAAEASERDLLDAEHHAARRLAASLTASGLGSWSSAVAEGERLLAEHRDTLLVRLISDGSPWLEPPPEPPAIGPGDQAATPPDRPGGSEAPEVEGGANGLDAQDPAGSDEPEHR